MDPVMDLACIFLLVAFFATVSLLSLLRTGASR